MHVVRLLGPAAKTGPAASENQSLGEQKPTWPPSLPLSLRWEGPLGGPEERLAGGNSPAELGELPPGEPRAWEGRHFLTPGGAGTCYLPTFLGWVAS